MSPFLQASFQQALALQRQGRLPAAAKLYDTVLQLAPRHFDTLHMRGVLDLQLGNSQEAIRKIGQALRLNPGIAAAHCNLGNALSAAGKLSEAIASYNSATALDPKLVQAHFNRGNALRNLQRPREAVRSYQQAIACNPGHAEAHAGLAVALKDLGLLAEAVASCDQALALRPDYAEAHHNRGAVLMELRRLDEAILSYQAALRLAPGADFNLGNYLYTRMQACDWDNLPAELASLTAGIQAGRPIAAPFTLFGLVESRPLQPAAAPGRENPPGLFLQ